jgi:hypothetical protein
MSGVIDRIRAWLNADGVMEPWHAIGDTRDFRRILVGQIVFLLVVAIVCLIVYLGKQ